MGSKKADLKGWAVERETCLSYVALVDNESIFGILINRIRVTIVIATRKMKDSVDE